MAGTHDLIINRGEAFSLNISLSGESDLLNLSGYNITGAIKYKFSDDAALVIFSPEIISPESGLINISLSVEESRLLPISISVYDIEVSNNSGDNLKPLKGYVYVNPEVYY